MKSNSDDYQDVLLLWESIWTCSAMRRHLNKLREEQRVKQEEAVSEMEKEKLEMKNVTESDSGPESMNAARASPRSTSTMSPPESFSSSTFQFSMKELSAMDSERESAELIDKMESSLRIEDSSELKGKLFESMYNIQNQINKIIYNFRIYKRTLCFGRFKASTTNLD